MEFDDEDVKPRKKFQKKEGFLKKFVKYGGYSLVFGCSCI